MTQDLQPLVRNLLRYLAGILVASGWLSDEAYTGLTDPAVMTQIAGVVIGIVSEVWYRYAKKNGKPT